MPQPTTGSYAITAWRNDDYFERAIRVVGLDLSNLALKMEIRLVGDTPGEPLVHLEGVATDRYTAQGLRVAGVSVVGDVVSSDLRIRMDRGTLQSLPYEGELGDAATFQYALLIGGLTRLIGPFILPAHAFGSDNAPDDRAEIYGAGRAATFPDGGATLTIGQDGGVTVVIDGADLVSDVGRQAAAAAAEAAADRETVEQISATSYRAVPTYGDREAIPLDKRKNGLRVQVMEGVPRVFEWRTDLYAPGAWTGLLTQAELQKRELQTGKQNQDTINGLPEALTGLDQASQNILAGVKRNATLAISTFAALAASSAEPVDLSWAVGGVTPRVQSLSWGGWSIDLDGYARALTLGPWTDRAITVLGDSVSDGLTAAGTWALKAAAQIGQPLTTVALYSAGSKQVYRAGAKPLLLTLDGNRLPAGGTAVSVTAINGAAPGGDNPASPLFTYAGDTRALTITGTIAGRHVTMSASGGGAAYSLRADAGSTAIDIPAGSSFVPDFAQRMGRDELWIMVSHNHFYSEVHPQNINPQALADVDALVRQARGQRICIMGLLPDASWVPGTKQYAAVRAFNAELKRRYPTYYVEDAQGRDPLARMVASGNGSAADNADAANGVTPGSLRQDSLHPNDAGNQVLAALMVEFRARQVQPPALVVGTTRFTLAADGDDGVGGSMSAVAVAVPQQSSAAPVIDATLTSSKAAAADLDGIPWLHHDAVALTGIAAAAVWSAPARAIARAIKSVSVVGYGVAPGDAYYIGTFAKADAQNGDRIIVRRVSDNAAIADAGTAVVTKTAGLLTRRVLTGSVAGAGVEVSLDIAYDEVDAGLLLNSATLTPLVISKSGSDAQRASVARSGFRARNIALDPAGALGTAVYQVGSGSLPAPAAAGNDLAAVGVVKSLLMSATPPTGLYKREVVDGSASGKYAFGAVFVSASTGVWPTSSNVAIYPYSQTAGGSIVAGKTEAAGSYVQLTPTLRWYWGRCKLPDAAVASIAFGLDALGNGGGYEIGGWTTALSETPLDRDTVRRTDWAGYSTRDGWRDGVDATLAGVAGAAPLAGRVDKLRAGDKPWFNVLPNPNLDPAEATVSWIGGNPVLATPASAEMVRRGVSRAVQIGTGGNNARLRADNILDANASGQFYFSSTYAYAADGATWPAPVTYWYAGSTLAGGRAMPNFIQVDATTRFYYDAGQLPARADLTQVREGTLASVTGTVAQVGGFTFLLNSTALTIDDVVRDEWYPQATRREALIAIARQAKAGGALPFAGETWAMFGDSITDSFGVPEQVAVLGGATVINGGFGGCRWTPGGTTTGMAGAQAQFSMVRLAQAIATGDWSAQTQAAADAYALDATYDKRAKVAALAALDWSKVTRMTLDWGTNDWSALRQLGTPNSTNENEINGAINLSIARILGKYPAMQLVLITPWWRGPNATLGDSNVNANSNGLYLRDVQDAIIERGRYQQTPVIRMHELVGINLANKATYLGDDLHPTVPVGRNRKAKVITNQMRLLAA